MSADSAFFMLFIGRFFGMNSMWQLMNLQVPLKGDYIFTRLTVVCFLKRTVLCLLTVRTAVFTRGGCKGLTLSEFLNNIGNVYS